MSKLSQETLTEFRRVWSRAESRAGDESRRYFSDNPDVLMAVADGSLLRELDKMRVMVELPTGGPTRPDDINGWKVIERGIIQLSLPTRKVTVDYRLKSKELLEACKIPHDSVGTNADLDDLMTNRRILRAGGLVTRHIKRLTFRDAITLDELRAIFRIKHAETGAFQPVDPRTLLCYAAGCPGDMPSENKYMAATATSNTMRGYNIDDWRLPVPYLHRRRSSSGPYIEYAHDDLRGRVGANLFTPSWTVLVDVTPPAQLP